jgi:hypothetical protein
MKISNILLKYLSLFYNNIFNSNNEQFRNKINDFIDFSNINLLLFKMWSVNGNRIYNKSNNKENIKYIVFVKKCCSVIVRLLQMCNVIHIVLNIPKIRPEDDNTIIYKEDNDVVDINVDLDEVDVDKKNIEIPLKKGKINFDDFDNAINALVEKNEIKKDNEDNKKLKSINYKFFSEDMDKWFYYYYCYYYYYYYYYYNF